MADVTLERAIATINAVDAQPDFVVFTGDLTHTTDDATERKSRMARVKEIASTLKVKDVRFLPGEHDAAPDHGDAYREAFGDLHYSFDHKGVHFVALDNVSQAGAGIGDDQLGWLAGDLAKVPAQTPSSSSRTARSSISIRTGTGRPRTAPGRSRSSRSATTSPSSTATSTRSCTA